MIEANQDIEPMSASIKQAKQANFRDPKLPIEVVLTVGKEINSINDIDAIFDSFVLPSWIPEHYDVRIYKREPLENGLFLYEVKLNTMDPKDNDDQHFLFREVSRTRREVITKVGDRLEKEKKYLKEKLEEGERSIDKELQQQNSIINDINHERELEHAQVEVEELFVEPASGEIPEVDNANLTADTEIVIKGDIVYIIEPLSKEKDPKREVKAIFKTIGTEFICIEFHDLQGFFHLLAPVSETKRIPTLWTLKPGELYYPYIEPENIRTKVFEEPHFYLAFQGGGAKGAAYIGAVQALKDDNAKVAVKSIIGSSAGGIIALALAAGCESGPLVNHCKKMTSIPKDTTYRDKGQVDQEQFKAIKDIIMQAIVSYGIMPEGGIYIIEGILTDQFMEKLMELLSLQMDGIGEMFDITVNGQTKKQNYYGLLLARLLRGKAVESIALDIIVEFLEKNWLNKPDNPTNLKKLVELYPELPETLRKSNTIVDTRTYAMALNMEQLYALNGVEFTVTSVDIDDSVLRFFNHKSTPSLPVHKAVIMTGSFPVAFEALKWQSEWGKYYIHYDKWRREIDLTGHQFTDGGMLANFPMMYLDNEAMRPMYFAHKCNLEPSNQENRTKIIGFGLEEIIDPKVVSETAEKTKKVFDELKAIAKSNLPWFYQVKVPAIFGSAQWKEIDAYDISGVPLVKFVYKLLKTFTVSSDNLVYEWFEKDICLHSPYKTIGQMLEKPEELLGEKLKGLADLIGEIKDELGVFNKLLSYVVDARRQLYKQNSVRKYLLGWFESTKSYIKNILHIIISVKEKKRNALGDDYVSKEAKVLDYQVNRGNEELQSIEELQSFGPLVRCFQSPDSVVRLALTCSFILKCFPKRIIQNRILQQPTALPTLESQLDIWFNSPVRNLLSDVGRKIQAQVYKIKRYEINEKMMFEEHEPEIRAYIESKIRQAEHRGKKNLHLVFQGSGEHNMYSYQIFKLIEDCLFKEKYAHQYVLEKEAASAIIDLHFPKKKRDDKYRYRLHLVQQLVIPSELDKILKTNLIELRSHNVKIQVPPGGQFDKILKKLKEDIAAQKQEKRKYCKISSITCSSMHSYLGFLLTTDLKPNEIESEITLLRQEFKTNFENSLAEFESKEWSTPFKCRINKEFQNKLWSQRKDLFSQLEEQLNKLDTRDLEARQKLEETLTKVQAEFEDSKEVIMDSYDSVLEQLLSNAEGENTQTLFKSMGVNVNKHDYFKENQEISKQTKGFVSMLLEYFEEQVKFILTYFATENEKELVEKLPPEKRKDAWKCMIITRFLTCEQLKKKVQTILKHLSLPKDITLKDYFKTCPRKLELTFPAVDLSSKKMRFINQKTYPQMPVWAAIAIGCSLPMIFPVFGVQSYWCQGIDPDSKTRLIKNFFSEQKHSQPPVFVSGTLISTFPLDLLTNRKVQDNFFNKADYTFMNFGVNTSNQISKKEEEIPRFFRKYLKVAQLANLALFSSYPKKELSANISIRANVLSTYIDAHDNLVLQLYNRELLRLPIRLSTLSFSKFEKDPTTGKENPVLTDMLDETYFSTKEKFHHISHNHTKADEGITFVELKSVKAGVQPAPPPQPGFFSKLWRQPAAANPWNPPMTILLNFLSRERNNKDFTKKYKIDYKFAADKWKQITEEGIKFPEGQQDVTMRFQYPAQIQYGEEEGSKVFKIRTVQFKITVTELMELARAPGGFSTIYSLDYMLVMKGKLRAEKRLSERLRLRDQVPTRSPNCVSIVDVGNTGLYCATCCQGLQHVGEGIPVPRKCTKCQKFKGIIFECPKSPPHEIYCLDCCKNSAVLRRGQNLFCELNHPYIAENCTVLPATMRVDVVCDLCQAYVQIFYNDAQCNLSICTKCCSQFTTTHML